MSRLYAGFDLHSKNREGTEKGSPLLASPGRQYFDNNYNLWMDDRPTINYDTPARKGCGKNIESRMEFEAGLYPDTKKYHINPDGTLNVPKSSNHLSWTFKFDFNNGQVTLK